MRKPSILVVDDQIMMTHFLAYYFRKNYNMFTRIDGVEALEWLKEGNIPNIIIADLDMSKISSFEFIHSVRTTGFLDNVPILILSSQGKSEERIKCLKLGAEDYLTKPFHPQELELKIKRILRLALN